MKKQINIKVDEKTVLAIKVLMDKTLGSMTAVIEKAIQTYAEAIIKQEIDIEKAKIKI